jgi:hypothetical protein
MKYLLIFEQSYNENTAECGFGDCPIRLDYIAAVVEGETLRKAQNAARKLFPRIRFGGMFSPMLIEVASVEARLYTKPADIRLSRTAVHHHREALSTLAAL